MPTQIYNDDMIGLMATAFQRRYEAQFAWGTAYSMYMQLPGLLAFYPGSLGYTGGVNALRNVSGSGLFLSRTGGPDEGADTAGLRRWINFNGTTEYFAMGDSAYNSVLGTETAVGASIRGMTIMAWVRPSTGTGAFETVASKYNSTGNQRSWIFRRANTGVMNLIVSGDGVNNILAAGANAVGQNQWHFVCGRWTPSLEIKVWEGYTYGLTSAVNTTSVPATLFDSTDNFVVGAINTTTAATNFWAGDLSLIAWCHAAVPDIFVETLFDLTRPMFIRR